VATTDIWEDEADPAVVVGLTAHREPAKNYELAAKMARYVNGPKLWFDRLVASVGLVVLSPLIGLIALLVRRTAVSSKRPRDERRTC